MQEKFIPEQVDPFRLAEQRVTLTGVAELSSMTRLVASLHAKAGLVTARLEFGIDEQDICFVKGHIETTLMLVCQRCMEPFQYEIIGDFVLGVTQTLEEAERLPKHYDPVLTQEGQLALRDLIEDELILNLPIIPRHAPELCLTLPVIDSGWEQGQEKNPFRALELLKQKQHKERGES